jgi:hypothetical protein
MFDLTSSINMSGLLADFKKNDFVSLTCDEPAGACASAQEPYLALQINQRWTEWV